MQLTTARQRQTGSGAFAADPGVLRTKRGVGANRGPTMGVQSGEASSHGGDQRKLALLLRVEFRASRLLRQGGQEPRRPARRTTSASTGASTVLLSGSRHRVCLARSFGLHAGARSTVLTGSEEAVYGGQPRCHCAANRRGLAAGSQPTRAHRSRWRYTSRISVPQNNRMQQTGGALNPIRRPQLIRVLDGPEEVSE